MLVYDGECGFCTSTALWLQRRLPEGYPVIPWQHLPDLEVFDLTEDEVRRASYWIDIDGVAHAGARGVARLLIACGKLWSALGWLLLVPPISWMADVVYRIIARYRHRLPGGTPACQRP